MKTRRRVPLWIILLASFGAIVLLALATIVASAFLSTGGTTRYNALCACGTFTYVPERAPIAAMNHFHQCHYCRREYDELTLRSHYNSWKKNQDTKKRGEKLPDPMAPLPNGILDFDVRPRH